VACQALQCSADPADDCPGAQCARIPPRSGQIWRASSAL